MKTLHLLISVVLLSLIIASCSDSDNGTKPEEQLPNAVPNKVTIIDSATKNPLTNVIVDFHYYFAKINEKILKKDSLLFPFGNPTDDLMYFSFHNRQDGQVYMVANNFKDIPNLVLIDNKIRAGRYKKEYSFKTMWPKSTGLYHIYYSIAEIPVDTINILFAKKDETALFHTDKIYKFSSATTVDGLVSLTNEYEQWLNSKFIYSDSTGAYLDNLIISDTVCIIAKDPANSKKIKVLDTYKNIKEKGIVIKL